MDPREITHKDPIEVITPLEGLFAIKMGSMIGTPEPSMMTPGKGQKRDASSDLENTIAKQLCLDEEILTPGDFGLSPIATPEGSSGKVRIPQEGSYVDLGEEDFTEVTKRNRKTHGTKNAAAFEEPIKDTHSPTPTGTRTWAHEPIQYVYVLYTFTKNMGEAELQDFAKGLAKHVGGFQSAYAPVQDQGPFFKMENSKAQKACKYEHPGIDIKYVSITKEKPENKPKKNDNEAGNTKSYAILRLGLNSPIDTLKKIFNFKKNQIIGASRINDKKGKPTTQVKLVFDKATPPTTLTEQNGVGYVHNLEPSLKHVIRCNKCQVFGHTSKKCRSKTLKCPHCAGPHTHAQCKNRKSANCGLTSNGAAYAGCSAYKQYEMKISLENAHIQDEWTRLKNQREASPQPPLPKPTMCTPTPPLAEPTITLSEAKKLTINIVKQVLTALATDKVLSIDPTVIDKYLPQGDIEIPTPTPYPDRKHGDSRT